MSRYRIGEDPLTYTDLVTTHNFYGDCHLWCVCRSGVRHRRVTGPPALASVLGCRVSTLQRYLFA
jgi:hypothetical protein